MRALCTHIARQHDHHKSSHTQEDASPKLEEMRSPASWSQDTLVSQASVLQWNILQMMRPPPCFPPHLAI